jgi:hypothetical protein
MMGNVMVALVLALWQLTTPAGPSPMTDQQFHQQIALEAVRHGGSHAAAGFLVPLGLFALILGIVWLAHRNRQANIQAQAEFHKQLLDKFGSGQEFAAFLESKGSQRFLDELWSRGAGARERTLRSMCIGVVATTLGLGMLGLMAMRKGFVVPAVILLAVGIGYLIVTFVSYRLSKQWGQIPDSGATNP